MNGNYDDIINLPHHQSTTHPHMPLSDRAAQFSPFAALSGYEAAIDETARLTDEQAELDEGVKNSINEKLQKIKEQLPDTQPHIRVTYFEPDKRKEGGAYLTIEGKVRKIDEYKGVLVMQDGMEIAILRVTEIS